MLLLNRVNLVDISAPKELIVTLESSRKPRLLRNGELLRQHGRHLNASLDHHVMLYNQLTNSEKENDK